MVSDYKKVLACVGLALMVQGCETSEWISKANPTNWFEDEKEKPAKDAEAKTVPGEGEDFPAIGSVPERPQTPDIKEDYEELKSGLIADMENAHHTDQVIRSGTYPERSLQGSTSNLVGQAEQTPEEPPVASSVKPAPSAVEPTQAPAVVAAGPVREQPQPAPSAEPLASASSPQKAMTPPPSPEPSARTSAAQPQVAQAEPQAAVAGKHVANIYFGDGQTQLSSHDREVVGQIVALYREQNGKGIKVVGHSSSSAGTKNKTRAGLVNFKVSLDRASAVAAELVRRGVPKSVIQVDARGEAQPLYTGNTKQAQAYNRRAEVFILYK
ncbi:OmpA family protein [Aestuariispira ectoiniformans]|uniref:OmpA family protein n=1 Tax=Aestuariispira ectoiniformans TaxID=2775080 RepID=UPI00223B37AB|nr:OmpA family protein [Aestuariispira ectoiniformans]